MKKLPLITLDRKIRSLSKKSKIAPPEFLRAELRRTLNQNILYGLRYRKRLVASKINLDHYVENLEQEYLAYFEPKKFKKTFEPNHYWKYVYAGCNGQIEFFLAENGFFETLDKLGFSKDSKPINKIHQNDVPEIISKYLIGIGYLYPQKDELIVHSNMLWGQIRQGTGDSSFLTRDLIRCSYYAAKCPHCEIVNGEFTELEFSNQNYWGFWKDLVALSIANLPQYQSYRINWVNNPKNIDRNKKIKDKLLKHLEHGRILTPQRYIELEPKIEEFSWYFPKDLY